MYWYGKWDVSLFGVWSRSIHNNESWNQHIVGYVFWKFATSDECSFICTCPNLGRDTIGIGTACNMVLVGYISDGMVQVLNGMMGASSLSFRILFLVSAMGIASFGVACYIKTELGVAPYDALQLMIEKYSRRKITYRIARIGCDLTCLVTGIFAVL